MSNNLENMFADAILKDGAERIQNTVNKKIEQIQNDLLEQIEFSKEELKKQINVLDDLIQKKPLTVNVGTIKSPKNKLVHKQFATILKVLESNKRIEKNIMLVGDCGSGKSSLCSDIADALKLQFYPMSVGLQTTKSDLIGFINAKGDYVTTPVREAFENGGILLLDEFDATHAGVVTILNSMLANNICSFPDKIVNKHKDFICIVACNTYGKGGSIEYVGRNRLDSATLDRFITINVGYDEKLEKKLVNHKEWLKVIKKIRKNIKESGVKVIVSPRASMQGADLLEAGFDVNDVLEMCILKGASEDIKNKLLKDIDFGLFAKNNDIDPNDNIPNIKINNKQNIENRTTAEIFLNFDNNTYAVSNLRNETNILSVSDWNGSYNIYLSTTFNNWHPTLNSTDLFLNTGNGIIDGCFSEDKNKFIQEMKYQHKGIRLKDEILKFIIQYKGITYEFITR